MGDLLSKLGRHNFRPNHLHMMIEAPGFHKLVTSLYPEGDVFLSSDPVFGVKKSLVVVSKRKCWLVVAFDVYYCIYFASLPPILIETH